jgi:hypothetical protein
MRTAWRSPCKPCMRFAALLSEAKRQGF